MRFDHRPQPAAAYGFEAMSLLLSAIRRAGGDGGDRGSVSDLVLATRERKSVIGEYSIRSSGDTTLEMVTAYSIRGCRLGSSTEIEGAPAEGQPSRSRRAGSSSGCSKA